MPQSKFVRGKAKVSKTYNVLGERELMSINTKQQRGTKHTR
jgi:hypothetical protein